MEKELESLKINNKEAQKVYDCLIKRINILEENWNALYRIVNGNSDELGECEDNIAMKYNHIMRRLNSLEESFFNMSLEEYKKKKIEGLK